MWLGAFWAITLSYAAAWGAMAPDGSQPHDVEAFEASETPADARALRGWRGALAGFATTWREAAAGMLYPWPRGTNAPAPAVLHLRTASKGGGIWGVWAASSYVYGLEDGPESLVLIGTGGDPQGRALLHQMAQRGYLPACVRTIILTHGSDSQTAALHHFGGASIWVHPCDVAQARRDVLPRPWPARLATRLRRAPLPKPRLQPLWPGQRFAIGQDTADIVALPGFTPGSVGIVYAGYAFVGDSLVGDTTGPALAGSGANASVTRNRQSLARLGHHVFDSTATTSAGLLPWGRARLCRWLGALPSAQAPPAALMAACADSRP